MAEKLDPKETVSFEELLLSNGIEQEALINLLEAKGMITKADLLKKIIKLREGLTCNFFFLIVMQS